MSKTNANYNQGITTQNISDACKNYMRIFGSNNNLMRHLPSMCDGLKPGERRLLYTMHLMKLNPNADTTKVEAITSATASELHPHGSSALYETCVKLTQPWSNIAPLITGQGNFGNPTGDSAAAPRYIEAKLSKYAWECFFSEFTEDIIDMKPNYLGKGLEPEYLPSKYPNVVINNTFGIGYGLATSIPMYNFKEVIELTLELIDNPKLNDILLIPDSPTGANIVDEGQFPSICATGKGKYRMRGVIDIDYEENVLTIKSTPFQASLLNIKELAIPLLQEMNCLKNLKDDSDVHHINYKIFLKKEIDPLSIVHMIYTKTQMEKTFPVNFNAVEDYVNYEYNVKDILIEWIEFRRETKRRFYNHKMSKYRERQHILDILLFILNKDNLEKNLVIIKKSENKKEMCLKLMKEYGISSLQAETISDMRLSGFSKEAYRKYVDENESIVADIAATDEIIRSPKKLDKIIKGELKDGIKMFGAPRHSELINTDNEVKIRDTNHFIVITANGLIKKLPDDIDNIGFINQGDYPIEIIEIGNTSELLIFNDLGNIYKILVSKLNSCPLTSEGDKLISYCNLTGRIVSIKVKPTDEDLQKIGLPVYFIMVTKNGIIKKTFASSYANIKNELLSMIIKDDDYLVSVKLLIGDADIILYTNKGYGVRFNASEIRDTSRMSIGVKGINLSKDEFVIGMDVANNKDKYIFVLTSRGTGKKCELSAFKTMIRNAKPLRIISLESDESVMTMRTVRGKEKFKAYLKSSIEDISIEDVPTLPRLSKGKKIIPVKKGEVIIDIKELIK